MELILLKNTKPINNHYHYHHVCVFKKLGRAQAFRFTCKRKQR